MSRVVYFTMLTQTGLTLLSNGHTLASDTPRNATFTVVIQMCMASGSNMN